MVEPRAVVIVADATFFGKRKDRLGTLVFKDVISDSIIAGKNIDTETAADYKYLLDQIIEQGFTVQAVVLDGKAGIAKVFEGIPVQMCHFHQMSIVRSDPATIFGTNNLQFPQAKKISKGKAKCQEAVII